MQSKKRRRNKYGAIKKTVNGIEFASKAEAEVYMHLLVLLSKGLISRLELQPRYELQPKFKHGDQSIRKIEYLPDFQYITTQGIIVIDVKGVETDVFKIKRKMLLYRYPHINFRTVKDSTGIKATL